MSRSKVIAIAIVAAASIGIVIAASQQKAAGPLVEVYKTPTCGCCSKWVEHMRANGFEVRTTDLDDVTEIKTSRGVPAQLQSCHTGIVNGYVIEGHVPAADVHRLLKEKPEVGGIAVGGMPVGSPGMEVEGVPAQRYNVMTFGKGTTPRVFAKH